MCLIKIETTFQPPLEEELVGYKVYRFDGERYAQEFVGLRASSRYKLGDTLIDNKKTPICINGTDITYPTGFHIFTKLEEAIIWEGNDHDLRTVKVKYTNIVATGIQLYGDTKMLVDVAKQLTLIEEYHHPDMLKNFNNHCCCR